MTPDSFCSMRLTSSRTVLLTNGNSGLILVLTVNRIERRLSGLPLCEFTCSVLVFLPSCILWCCIISESFSLGIVWTLVARIRMKFATLPQHVVSEWQKQSLSPKNGRLLCSMLMLLWIASCFYVKKQTCVEFRLKNTRCFLLYLLSLANCPQV